MPTQECSPVEHQELYQIQWARYSYCIEKISTSIDAWTYFEALNKIINANKYFKEAEHWLKPLNEKETN